MVAFVALASWEPFWAKRDDVALSDRVYTAEIIRDEFGVPHIYGKTDADVAYGVAVAHSEDDFATLPLHQVGLFSSPDLDHEYTAVLGHQTDLGRSLQIT